MKKTLAWAVVGLAAFAQPALAGGQQVRAQPSADGTSVIVRTYRCGTPSSFTVRGTAEGMINGERRTIPLAISPASEEGVFRVPRQWPAEGKWALVFSVEGERRVSTLVELAPGASVRIARQKTTYEKPTAENIRSVLASAAPAGSR